MTDIDDIEKSYKESLENLSEWNYLRNYYREAQTYTINGREEISKKQILLQAIYGFRNWFKTYDYIVFSDAGSRKIVDNKFYDIRNEYIIETLNKNNTLLIETPSPEHINIKKVYTKHITSRRLIDIIALTLEKFDKKKYNIDVLNKINTYLNINFNYSPLIKRFNARYKVYYLWFKFVKPKVIFLNCFYDKQYIVRVAKELNIQVIDIQHGMIGKNHSAYHSKLNLDHTYLPDYLFVFGLQDKQYLSKGTLFEENQIFVVGNYYLEILKQDFQEDPSLKSILSMYKLSIGVSLQWTVEEELISFINTVAKEKPEVMFILIPRKYDKSKYQVLNLEKNVIFYPSLDCYKIIMHCHYHCTVYSTCAMEAPSLGIPNLLVNLNNMADQHMNNMFSKETTHIVNTKDEFIKVLNEPYTFEKDKLIESNAKYFLGNYRHNVMNALKYIKEEKNDR